MAHLLAASRLGRVTWGQEGREERGRVVYEGREGGVSGVTVSGGCQRAERGGKREREGSVESIEVDLAECHTARVNEWSKDSDG